jgi:hypothetical protein
MGGPIRPRRLQEVSELLSVFGKQIKLGVTRARVVDECDVADENTMPELRQDFGPEIVVPSFGQGWIVSES